MVADNEENNLDSFMTEESFTEDNSVSSDIEGSLEDFMDDPVPQTDNSPTTDSSLDDILADIPQPEDSATIPDETLDTAIKEAPQSDDAVITAPASSVPQTNEEAVSPARPKLKKIKRLKIRPMSGTPVAPQKVEPSADNNVVASDDFSDDFQDNETAEKQNTSLITASDANDISQNTEFDNSYILEGLPPELDYVTGDDGEAIYPETGIMAYRKPIVIALGCFLVGMLLGAIFFSTKTEEKHGLEDVILNPDVPQGRARCGLTDKSQACIFYIMNCYKQELTGRDFFKLAATLTGREEYMIETENLRYATVKIKPGAFAQLNIPALK